RRLGRRARPHLAPHPATDALSLFSVLSDHRGAMRPPRAWFASTDAGAVLAVERTREDLAAYPPMVRESIEPLARPTYRPDIDGLRAIAVLSVVGFHAFPTWFHGGFVGVDIFFVISGYLISTIIFGNLERGSFSYAEFYSRRIKRIFPALIV